MTPPFFFVFGVCGKAGAGKDTFSNFLVEKYGFVKVSFAETLKDVLSLLFGWERHLLEGDTPSSREWRETFVDEFWSKEMEIPNFTPRKAMQTIGTDVFRNHFHPNIWVSILKRKIIGILTSPTASATTKGVVVSDCRFPNEIEMLRQTFLENFYLFVVVDNNDDDNNKILKEHHHESETSLPDQQTAAKIVIVNDHKTTVPFSDAVKNLLEKEET